jgi:hypothetical protein
MNQAIEIGLTPPVRAMDAFVDGYRGWIEAVIGCPRGEALTFETDFPFSHHVLEEMLDGVDMDRRYLWYGDAVRPLIRRWETPPGVSPRIELTLSRDRRARVTERKQAWGPQWRETPIGVWLHGFEHGIVGINIPYVSHFEKGALNWRNWIIVNRRDGAACLNTLRQVEPLRTITVVGGRDIPLREDGYDWDSVVLDPAVNGFLRADYETFWESEAWFVEQGLPYRRGFLLYGPPGNGKTTVARIMASHPQVSSLSIDFSCEGLPNAALTDLFQAAGDRAPAVIILEDLDRVFGTDAGDNRSAITLQHLLSCLDGLEAQNGIVVAATANDPAALEHALLRRPGRFDRLVAFPPPAIEIRRLYLERLTKGALDEQSIAAAAKEADRMSFAQVREAYILAGQRSFARGGGVRAEELMAAIQTLRAETNCAAGRTDGRMLGFGSAAPLGEWPSAGCGGK